MFGKVFLAFLLSFSCTALCNDFYNIPNDLLARAITAEIVYDEDFDYTKIGRISNLYDVNKICSSTKQNTVLVDHVVVNKAAHQMLLLKDGQVVKTFWIALSDKPYGKKQFEGDKRTPEGTYILDYIKRKSNYYKAFHISYPNTEDIKNARLLGKRPGGMIMVHGQPPSKSEYHESVQRTDWTNGCIALLNHELDIFFSMVSVGTPITINP
ncbi:MAG: murein L,D-transpeptidase family protein [Succinivibrio sp.]